MSDEMRLSGCVNLPKTVPVPYMKNKWTDTILYPPLLFLGFSLYHHFPIFSRCYVRIFLKLPPKGAHVGKSHLLRNLLESLPLHGIFFNQLFCLFHSHI